MLARLDRLFLINRVLSTRSLSQPSTSFLLIKFVDSGGLLATFFSVLQSWVVLIFYSTPLVSCKRAVLMAFKDSERGF